MPNLAGVPILAPITSDSICPLGPKERWELRCRPLGCAVSTTTLLTCVVSVVSTLAVLVLGWLLVKIGKSAANRSAEGGMSGLLPFELPIDTGSWGLGSGRLPFTQSQNWEEESEEDERRPLLA